MAQARIRVQIPEDRGQMWSGFVIWVVFGFFSFVPRATLAAVAVYLSVAAAAGLWAFRAQRACLEADAQSVVIRGVLRDRAFGWSEIDSFVRGFSLVGPVVQVRLLSGRSAKAVVGTAAGGPFGGEQSQRELLRALTDLNQLLLDNREA